MRVRNRILILVAGGLLCALASAGTARAGEKSNVKRIESLNTAAANAAKAGDNPVAKTKLLDAVVLAKENGLGTHAVMAQTYLQLGVLHVEGLKDVTQGQHYFVLALRVNPKLEVPQAMASKPVMTVFNQARVERTARAAAEAKQTDEEAIADDAESAATDKKAAAADKKLTAADKKQHDEKVRLEEEKAEAEKELARAQGREKSEREAKDRLDRDRLNREKELADVKDKLDKERAAGTKDLAALSAAKNKELADLKAAKDKELGDLKAARDKEVAELKESVKKEREEKEQLKKERADLQKALADLGTREQKERTAREKLDAEKLLADAKERDRKAVQEKERIDREKLAEGPALPSSIPEPLYCPTHDEGPLNTDIYFHCATQGSVKAKEIAIYYRPSGVLHYNSLVMKRNKTGWFTAAVPASAVPGKLLQYYIEAQGAKGDVAANIGKADLPNIMMLKAGAPAVAAESNASGAKPASFKSAKSRRR